MPDDSGGQAGLQISPEDRDIAIRTMLGEEESPDGQAGVASVLLNRAASGKYGQNVSDVALAPGQFQSWARRGAALSAISATDPAYQAAGRIFDGVASGEIPDFTNGSTNFYAPGAQAAEGRAAPSWATGTPVRLGQSLFYAPNGPSNYAPAAKAISEVTSQPSQPDIVQQYLAPAVSAAPKGDIVQQYLAPSSSATRAASPPDIVQQYVGNSGNSVSAIGDEGATPTQLFAMTQAALNGQHESGQPGSEAGFDRTAPVSQQLSFAARAARDYATGQAAALPGEIADEFKSGVALAKTGATNLLAGNLAPSFPSSDPRTWSAGGALQTLGGASAALYSPVSAAVNKFVEEPVTQATGNPEIGARAGLVANILAGPTASRLAGKASALSAEGRATSQIKDVLGPQPSPDITDRLSANPRLSLMDVDPNLQQYAMGIANQPGPGRAILNSAVNNRLATAPAAVQSAYDAALGQTPDVPALLDSLKATARANAQQGFGAALSNAKPVDISPVLQAIDAKLTPGVNSVISIPSNISLSPTKQALLDIRQQLSDGTSNLTDANDLHQIQSQLRVASETLGNSVSGQDRLVGGAIGQIRGKLVDAIDEASGGAYKPAQKQFADDMAVQDAFNRGLTLLQNKSGESGLADRPDAFQREWSGMSPDAQTALQQGLRVAVDQKINSVRFAARRGTDIPDVGFNQDKLATVLGPDAANQLMQQMNDERDVATTNANLFKNSQTAPRLAGQAATQVRPVNKLSLGPIGLGLLGEAAGTAAGYPFWTGAAMMGAGLAKKGSEMIGRARDISRNTSLANLLAAPGADAIQRIYAPAAASSPVRNLLAGGTTGALGINSGNKFVDLPASSNQ